MLKARENTGQRARAGDAVSYCFKAEELIVFGRIGDYQWALEARRKQPVAHDFDERGPTLSEPEQCFVDPHPAALAARQDRGPRFAGCTNIALESHNVRTFHPIKWLT